VASPIDCVRWVFLDSRRGCRHPGSPQRRPAQSGGALGDGVDMGEEFRIQFVEHLMKLEEVIAFYVPVGLLRLAVEVEGIGEVGTTTSVVAWPSPDG